LARTKFLFHDRAILISTGRTKHLVIGDLHIGFESRLLKEGVRLQPSITNMQRNLDSLISQYGPQHLIVLGDIKSGTESITDAEWKLVPEFFGNIATKAEVTVVPGNHDGGLSHLLPSSVQLGSISGILIGSNLLTHGHTNLTNDTLDIDQIVMGHLHPTFNQVGSPLSGQPVWILLRISREAFSFRKRGLIDIVVLPSFNPELSHYGYSILYEKNISPILRRARGHIKRAAIVTLDGDIVGDISLLKCVLSDSEYY
jgi:putative SbcD/Mre11-related phosphoesterase